VIQATTPDFMFRIKDAAINLEDAENVYVTFTQNHKIITKTGDDIKIDKNTVSVWMNQKDTVTLNVGTMDAQINWTYLDEDQVLRRNATLVIKIPVRRNLLQRVIQ